MSHIRYNILGLLFMVSLLTFLDRVNISVAGKFINEAYGFSPTDYGIIFSAFVFGYMLFQLPGGFLADRLGARLVLTIAIVWWSVFTIITAIAGNIFLSGIFGALGSFIIIRFLIGLGEGVAYPASSKVVSIWIPYKHRAFANGVLLSGIGVGSAITPPLITWIVLTWGWQSSFYITGAVGFLVAAGWYLYARDNPRDHTGVNQEELGLLAQSPDAAKKAQLKDITAIIKDHRMWVLFASYFIFGYIIYIYYSWFFLYLINVKHIEIVKGSFMAAMPFLAMAVTAPLGGFISDRVCSRIGFRGRKLVGIASMLMVGVMIYFGSTATNIYMAVGLLSAGAGFLFLTVGNYWAAATDLHTDKAGSATGFMNTGANIGGTISPTLTPIIAATYGWDAALIFASALAILGAFLWLGILNNKDNGSG